MPDYLKAFEFACKTARAFVRGVGAPTLPGPLDDGDLLAQAEEANEVLPPWWSRCAVEAKAAKTGLVGEWQFSSEEQFLLGLKEGDRLGPGVVGPPVEQTSDAAGATFVSAEDPPRGVEEAPRGADSPIFEWSERGFRHYKPVITAYGHTVKVYDSSAASAPHVWLAVDTEGAQTTSPNAHCTVEQATVIRDQLTHFIENAES